jgi:hypothetical protein
MQLIDDDLANEKAMEFAVYGRRRRGWGCGHLVMRITANYTRA